MIEFNTFKDYKAKNNFDIPCNVSHFPFPPFPTEFFKCKNEELLIAYDEENILYIISFPLGENWPPYALEFDSLQNLLDFIEKHLERQEKLK